MRVARLLLGLLVPLSGACNWPPASALRIDGGRRDAGVLDVRGDGEPGLDSAAFIDARLPDSGRRDGQLDSVGREASLDGVEVDAPTPDSGGDSSIDAPPGDDATATSGDAPAGDAPAAD